MKRIFRRLTSPTARIIGTLWVIVILVSGFVVHTSLREVSCDREFRAALIVRAQYNEETDQLDALQDKAMLDWVHDLANPPETVDINNAGARQEWLHTVADKAEVRANAIITSRASIFAERRKHPFPELTCGR